MKITLNYNDIGFNSSSTEVEAMRRALEIRTMSLQNGNSSQGCGPETYVWETPLRKGHREVETVTVCEASGTLTYSRQEMAQAC